MAHPPQLTLLAAEEDGSSMTVEGEASAGAANLWQTSDVSSAEVDCVKQQIRDVLLRFPCTSLEGVRTSVLWRTCGTRFPAAASRQQPSTEELLAWLGDLAEYREEDGGRDGIWKLKASAALTRGFDGQLACWPLFLQRLGEIVRTHGSLQHAHALEVPHEEGASEEMVIEPSCSSVGVLLSQLKPLLRRDWDATFDEKSAAFYNESGSFVAFKKMKHLVAEVLKWRARRRSIQKSTGVWTEVDAAIEAPVFLAVSQRYNDMVLCCPVQLAVAPEAALPVQQEQATAAAASAAGMMSPSSRRVMDFCASGTATSSTSDPRATADSPSTCDGGESLDSSCRRPLSEVSGSTHRESTGSSSWADISESEKLHDTSMSTQGDSESSMWHEGPNRESKLRIEIAELKKRLRFEADRYQKEISRLRIENAELKKRLFVTRFHNSADSAPGQPQAPAAQTMPAVHPIWVPAQAMLTPVVPTEASAEAGWHGGMTPASVPSSGQVSPCQKGSLTPIHRFCYAVPMPTGMVSPCGQAIGPPWVAAVPVGAWHDGGSRGTSVVSPFSDLAKAESMLPKSLFGSDPTSSQSQNSLASHSAVCTPSRQCVESASSVQMKCTDDRWASIPSGIVERQKAQFETAGGPPFEAAEGFIPCADGQCAPSPGDLIEAPSCE
eukprot:CAMPEP_0178432830 /NCGR_PEP_ID=MMETSP0689_2-20121128/32594_1 /TAXON_ID=160604 /ORGANISM="Amphidinium massartii, Strain CS-259" /LENGTH=664 /DNA_ID=CAMNT_0020054843 /DNA_START=44 /DNA_END=2035 /DNA_ORIENTATION=+